MVLAAQCSAGSADTAEYFAGIWCTCFIWCWIYFYFYYMRWHMHPFMRQCWGLQVGPMHETAGTSEQTIIQHFQTGMFSRQWADQSWCTALPASSSHIACSTLWSTTLCRPALWKLLIEENVCIKAQNTKAKSLTHRNMKHQYGMCWADYK